MDSVWVADVARYYCVIVALWLAALLLKLTYDRVRRYGWARQDTPHPLTTLGLAVLMFVSVARRFDNLGKPGDLYLWTVCCGITLVFVGALVNVKFDLSPPWRRRRPGATLGP